jgi:hypothetical protein
MILSEKELRDGKEFTFANEDQSVFMDISFGKTASSQKQFKVFFNGKFISITKTFPPAKKEAERLIEKWNLKELV